MVKIVTILKLFLIINYLFLAQLPKKQLLMEFELIHENDFAKALYDRENKILRASYNGLVNPDKAIENFEAIIAKLPEYPLRGGIFDCMNMKGTFTKVNDWLNSVWYPAIIPQGYIGWSMATTDVFTRFAANMLINKMTPKEITAKLFGSLDKAEEWTYDFLRKHP